MYRVCSNTLLNDHATLNERFAPPSTNILTSLIKNFLTLVSWLEISKSLFCHFAFGVKIIHGLKRKISLGDTWLLNIHGPQSTPFGILCPLESRISMNSFLSPDARQNTSTPTGRELGENEHRARSESLGTTLIVYVHFDEPVKKREGKFCYPVRA